MSRTQNLFFAAMLMTSATAFAQDTPDPASKAEPPGSKPVTPSEVEGLPTTTPPPAAKQPPMTGQRETDVPATAPGEENKGKPPVAPQ
jgi:hypothetical protein